MTTFIVVVLGLALAFALIRVIVQARMYPKRQVEQLVLSGRFDEAAAIATRFEKLADAATYWERAGKHARAAQLFARIGQHARAAEMYEQAGEETRAAHQRELAARQPVAPPPPAPEPEPSEPAAPPSVVSAPEPSPGAPGNRAQQVEADFRATLAAMGESETERARVRELAREAADALLAAGDIRRAADVYRDGGCDEEAIHLYVNLLGAPREAAPLLAARGNHERAAELYQLAGDRERAAAAWVEVARRAAAPETFLDRIATLSDEVLVRFLRERIDAEPAADGIASLRERLQAAEARVDTAPAEAPAVADQHAVELADDDGDDGDAAVPAPLDSSAAQEAVDAAVAAVDPSLLDLGSWDPGSADVLDVDLGLEMATTELDSLAREVAAAAAERAREGDVIAQLQRAEPAPRPPADAATPGGARGLERSGASFEALRDAAVRGARLGPSIEVLERTIGGRPCDLQNIEVYYRLGLAQLAAGLWDRARAAFDAVEEASPGYRDAAARADQIGAWREALGPRATVGGAGRNGPRYTLHGELGRSPLSVVYRAADQVLGRHVALQLVADDMADAEARVRFEDRARAIARLQHPNIVALHDHGILEGRVFAAMEHVEGRPLEHATPTDRAPVVEALRVFRQVLDALACAHAAGIVHGDVRPENLIRSAAGLVKLRDFGLKATLSAAGTAAEPPDAVAYRAPEQLRGEPADARADQFAVGVCLYEMLTGTLPFTGTAREGPAPRARATVASLPEVVDDAIAKALALDPADRFPSAVEMSRLLRGVLDKVDRHVTMSAMAAVTAPPKPAPAPLAPAIPRPTGYSVRPQGAAAEENLGPTRKRRRR